MSAKETIRVLLIEDNEDDSVLVLDELRRGGFDVSSQRVDDEVALLRALDDTTWDIIISDFSLPNFNALAALEIYKKRNLDIPFLIVTGTIGEETAVDVIRAGAHDYLLKGKLKRLASAVRRAISEARMRAEKKKVEQELNQTALELVRSNSTLKQQSDIMQSILESVAEGILVSDGDGNLIYVNSAAQRLLGLTKLRTLSDWNRLTTILQADGKSPCPPAERPLARAARGETIEPQELLLCSPAHPNGIWLEMNARPLLGSSGTRGGVLVFRDIRAKKEAELLIAKQQLTILASSKMSALGEMAGGIVHEINNPLTIIIGFAEQSLVWFEQAASDTAKLKTYVEKIMLNANRVAKIVKGLRSISRNSDRDPYRPTPLASVLEDALELSRERLKTRQIELRYQPPTDLKVECRPSEIIQVMLNLIGNACDAIESLDERWIALEISADEQAVTISVTDSGNGVPEAIRGKITEPFFTTKHVGKGNGLGLSISRKILEDHGGSLRLDVSAPHTRFVISLPRRHATPQKAAA